MKRFYALVLSLVLALGVLASPINPPKGFTKRVYDATYALYATSVDRQLIEPKFICTVTAVQKFREGYLLLGAGHCTQANPELPADMKFFIETDINRASQPMELLTAKMTEDFEAEKDPVTAPLDYAVFYLKTRDKLTTVGLGDESSLKIGSPIINVNFSLGTAKYLSPGVVSSYEVISGMMKGFYGVQMFASHGASGSSVVDIKTKKIVGLVIAGEDGATVSNWIEPISHIEADLSGVNFDKLIVTPLLPNVQRPDPTDYYNESGASLLNGFHGSHSGSGGAGKSHGSGSGGSHTERPHATEQPRHEGGRRIDHDTARQYFGREHGFRPEVYYNGGLYSFYYAGLWFDYEYEWPYPAEDVFIDMDGDYYFMYSPAHPGVRVQVWIP
jgi:Trypsin-like peptidase domain